MPRRKQPENYVAISTGVIRLDGKIHRYIAGQTIIHRSHPLYRALPDRFQPLEAQRGIEQATAAPGELR